MEIDKITRKKSATGRSPRLRNIRGETSTIALDAWQLLETALNCDDGSVQEWQFEIQDGNIDLVSAAEKSESHGKLLLCICWPASESAAANGFVCLSHPMWDTLPYRIPLVGMPTGIQNDRDWRFLCPIKRTLHQVLFWNLRSGLFVSHAAIGQEQRRSDFRRVVRALRRILLLQHKWGTLDEKPARMSWIKFNALKDELDELDEEWHMAASGVPELILTNDGSWDVMAMSERAATKRSRSRRGMYYLDKTGTLRMSPTLKKRFGML
jgi:hypothetical protein